MDKFIMFVIGMYIFNLNHWAFKFVRTGVYGLMLVDLIKNLKVFNIVNVLMILTGFFILNLPNVVKHYFIKNFYCR